MRTKKPTNGKVTGVKFAIRTEQEITDLKKEKARLLQELADQEKKVNEWYDKELEKYLNK